MSSKEFDLMMSLILKMLESGQTAAVIALIKEAINKDKDTKDKDTKSKNNADDSKDDD